MYKMDKTIKANQGPSLVLEREDLSSQTNPQSQSECVCEVGITGELGYKSLQKHHNRIRALTNR